MNRVRPRALVVAVALAGTRVPAAEAADSQDASAAREIFKAGIAAMKDGDIRAACPKFAEAHRLDPNVGYVVNLARCEEKSGELVKARQHWQEARDIARKRNDPRAPEVESGFSAVDAQVPRLVIHKAEPSEPGLAVRIDDVELGAASVGVAVPVDPGTHKLVAHAQGYEDWTTTVAITKEGRQASVTIPALRRSREESAAVASAESSTPERPTGPASEPPSSTQRTLGIVALAAGAVGLGVGTIFAVRASSLNGDSKAKCDPTDPNLCSDEGVSLRRDAGSSADVATAAFVAGTLLAAGGLVLFFTAPKSTRSARVAVGVSPIPSLVLGTSF